MEIDRFTGSPIGQLRRIQGQDAFGRDYDHFAYVPDPLPDEIPLSSETWDRLTSAGIALGRLDGEGRRLPNPSTLARPQIREEAVKSSALEGTYTTLPQVLQGELIREASSADVDEVLDHVRAAESGFQMIKDGRPLGINMIKEVHRILMASDRRCAPHEKGEIRDKQNFIGKRPDSEIADSWFVPPPPGDDLLEGVFAWEKWIHQDSVNLLVRLAVGHYQFETLHPFVDGNGRIGRLIVIFLLLHEKDGLSVPLLNLSPHLEAHREEYQGHLRELSATGDFNPWVQFFAETVQIQSNAGVSKVEALLSLQKDMVLKLRANKIRGMAIQIAEDLIGYPVITPTDIRDRYNVSYQAASNAIGNLVNSGCLTPVDIKKRKIYACMDVLSIVHS